jgi:predicted dienelactone hydrolase
VVSVGGNGVFQGVRGFAHTPVAAGRHPLILIAYGGFRVAPNAASWLAAPLADAGNIVAVVAPPPLPEGRPTAAVLDELWLRPADLSAGITALTHDAMFGPALDPHRISAIGVFLGGFTALELAGATVGTAAYARACDRPSVNRDCAWFAQGGLNLHQLSTAKVARSAHDERVDAVIAIDPELGTILTAQGLRAIAVPVTIINLTLNGVPFPSFAAQHLAAAIPKAAYGTVPDAGPFGAFPACKPKGLAILQASGGETALCEDGGGRPRAAVHAALLTAIIAALPH